MKKFNGLKERIKGNDGFSLVELIIVIAILAVIAGIAIPNILGAVEDSRYATDVSNGRLIAEVATLYAAENEGLSGETYTIEANSSDSVVKEIVKSLNGAAPKAKSKTFGKDSNFVLNVKKDDGTISVTCGGKAVFPTPVAQVD